MPERPLKKIDRFVIDHEAGSGAMGTIYRAVDAGTGRRVALKVLRGMGRADAGRFMREAHTLAALQHPAIVGYVDHGDTEGGDSYLAMEWLDGEDLRARLAREGLTIGETLALARQLAGGLAELHRHRLVHRDIKPANIFLVSARVEECKLVDFGLARVEDASVELTHTGAIIGTPQYMSPEQARGERVVTASSDIFSLGCVLFRCLTGRVPFEGASIMAVLTRVLLDASPRPRTLNPAVPVAFDALVQRMLAKNPAERFANGAALLDELEGVAAASTDEPAMMSAPSVRSQGLSAGEHRLAAMVLVGAAPVLPDASPDSRPSDPDSRLATTLVAGAPGLPQPTSLLGVVEQHRGQLETLFDGTRVVTLPESAIATDQATDAARCALAVRDTLPQVPIGLVMVRSGSSSRGRITETIDRLVAQLERSARALARRGASPSIAIDDTIASLLGPRFVVPRDDDGASLAGESERETRARTLLGKATALVGRDWEMSTLLALFRECAEEPAARPVLVTGPAGMGKSRLASEIVPAIARAHPGVEVWTGRGLSLRAGSPLALLGSVLRNACGIRSAAPLDERRARVLARVQRRLPAADVQRVAEMIGELAGAPFPHENSPSLRAARADGRVMGEQTLRAFKELLAAESAAQPVLLVLEDLHWGDPSTVRFVDEALRDLAGTPWMVLALARPEVHERFAVLWPDRNIQELRLKPLARRAAERLVRDVLGASIDAATVTRIVARAEGNAFHLEELIRAFAERRGQDDPDNTLPPTVLAMAQARLDALDPELRRMLRAASIFGEVFWLDGVMALLGSGETPESWGRQLEARELVVRRAESRFEGHEELMFRHTLLREGAYAMLHDADRALGHRLAGDWLERHGESDPLILATHFDLGGEPARASAHYLNSARRAMRAFDLDAAAAIAAQALAGAPSPEAKLPCQALLAEIHAWRLEWAEAWPHLVAVTEQAAPGTVPWIHATSFKQSAGIFLHNPQATREAMAALLTTDPVPEGLRAMAEGLSFCVVALCIVVQFRPAAAAVFKVDALVAPRAAEEPVARGFMHLAHVYQELWGHGNAWSALEHAEAARAAFTEANDTRDSMYSQVFVGSAHLQLGAYAEAERELRGIPDGAVSMVTMLRESFLARTWLDQGRHEEARALLAGRLAQLLQAPAPDSMRVSHLGWMLGEVERRSGDCENAERTAAAAAEGLTTSFHERPLALASLSAARLALGRPAEALPPAREAAAALEAHGGHAMCPTFIRLVHAEALHATGDHPAAVTALTAARDHLLAWAAHIPDSAARQRYLEAIPEHARTLALAREWGIA